MEMFNAKAHGVILESTVGADQNGKLWNVREVSELWCACVLRLARVPIKFTQQQMHSLLNLTKF